MKYLVAGLGNMGEQYARTRHNIGFMILDELSSSMGLAFQDRRYGMIARCQLKGRTFVLLKPTTYVNLSGLAVMYWLKKERIGESAFLAVVDDTSLPFGTLRLKPAGGDGGHNGLASISQVLGTREYARLRFGIGSDFMPGGKVSYVLGEWTQEEQAELPARVETATEMIISFGLAGVEETMNRYNNR